MSQGLHRLLARQLRKLGIDALAPPGHEAWRKLLAAITLTYRDADEERYTMERSLVLTSEEMLLLYQRQKAATNLGEAVSGAQSLGRVYEVALDALEHSLGCDRGAIFLFDPQGGMHIEAVRHIAPAHLKCFTVQSPWRIDERNPQPIFVPQLENWQDDQATAADLLEAGVHSLACFPLLQQSRLLGHLVVYFNAPRSLNDEEAQMARTIAHHVGYGIADKQAAAALRDSEQRWRFALEGGGDVVWDWNLETDQVLLSKGYRELLGYDQHEIGDDMAQWHALVHPEDTVPLDSELRRLFHDQGEKIFFEYRVRCKDGLWKWILTRGMVVKRSAAGRVAQMIGTHTDITARKENEAKIHLLAFYDPLTNLPNRRLLQDRLKQSIAAAARSGLLGALFFIDLDNFKSLNDSRGHDVGDQLLAMTAVRLREAVRKIDTVARQGGDEFVVVMEELGETVDEAVVLATHLGDKLRLAMALPFNLDGFEYHCKTSIGVGLFHGKDSVAGLFKQADLALYQAKNSGRNKLRFFNPAMQEAMNRRSTLEHALHKAVSNHEFRLYYQPQVDAKRNLIGVEALLRWQHPQLGLVAPDDFIPLAEDTGLILPIGRWVLETACAQIKAWERDPLTQALQIAVNVSAQQFRQPDFEEQVSSVLATSGANPTRLKLELTESMMLEDVQETVLKMRSIKQLDVLFSMDDFGTGYSSLSYLTQLPLDQIKIDKAFVRNLPGSKNDETIARAVIAMGAGLHMHVIAEGVETEAQLEFLEALGCHAYQGYLFSRPLPIEALCHYLRHA